MSPLPYFSFDFTNFMPRQFTEDNASYAKATSTLEKLCQNDVGFFSWPDEASEELFNHIHQLALRLREQCSAAIVFAIGGSYLGPRAIDEVLRREKDRETFPLFWLANVDPDTIADAEHFLEKYPHAAAVVISKSGTTAETLTSFFHLSSYFSPENIVVITDEKKGELRRLALQEKWQSFTIPENIGGRFSVLTPVGLFPAALMGFEAQQLLRGAKRVKHNLLESRYTVALQFAYLFYYWNKQGKNLHYFIPYRFHWQKLAEWNVQLWAESLGKERQGVTPVVALGSLDQHSLLQLFQEGPKDKVFGFIDEAKPQEKYPQKPQFLSSEYQYLFSASFSEFNTLAREAVTKSLASDENPCYTMIFSEVSLEALGGYFFFMETACALAAQFFSINAFDQPGVEKAKKLWRAALESKT